MPMNQKQMPIGPKIRNLNKEYTYEDGPMNQLKKWAETGYLLGYDELATHPELPNGMIPRPTFMIGQWLIWTSTAAIVIILKGQLTLLG